MEILQTIEEIIKRNFKVSTTSGHHYLEETEVSNYPKTLVKKKGKMLVYSFDVKDSNISVFPIFNSQKKDLTKVCDYLIFYPKNDILFTFICDLKSKKSGAKKQVESGWVLAEYIINMARKDMKFANVKTEFRALVFSTSQKSKFASTVKAESWVILPDSKLKNKLLKAGSDLHLDTLCF